MQIFTIETYSACKLPNVNAALPATHVLASIIDVKMLQSGIISKQRAGPQVFNPAIRSSSFPLHARKSHTSTHFPFSTPQRVVGII